VEEEVNDPKMSPYANFFFVFFSTCVRVDEFSRGVVNFLFCFFVLAQRETRRVWMVRNFCLVTSLGDITVRSAVHYCYYGVEDRTDVSVCLYLSKNQNSRKTRNERKKKKKREKRAEIPHTKASGGDRTGRYGTSHAHLSPATTTTTWQYGGHQQPAAETNLCKAKWKRWESFRADPIAQKRNDDVMRGIFLFFSVQFSSVCF
jgi:hypothetical protein